MSLIQLFQIDFEYFMWIKWFMIEKVTVTSLYNGYHWEL